ncbi:unnamed protein product [Schistocephalus solidus]|uniref:Small intestine urate exporter n=1 Tax=Schistocephalus solidus TaxID=70667 RepID=A0A183SV75_SCHSO|nr:unnamed protein product [Schistocephalus solidus]
MSRAQSLLDPSTATTSTTDINFIDVPSPTITDTILPPPLPAPITTANTTCPTPANSLATSDYLLPPSSPVPAMGTRTLFSGLVGSFLTEIFTWRIPFFLIGSLAVLWSALVFQTMLRFPPPVLFLHKVGPVPSPPIKPSSYRQGSGLVSFEFALTPSGSLSLQKHQTCSAASSSPPPPSLVEVATAVATSDNLRGSAALRAASAVPLNWRRLCRKSAFWSMIFGNFTFNNTFLIILNWSPSFFHDRFPESQSWVFNVVPWLIVIPCSLLSGVLADKLITQGLSVTLVRKIITTQLNFTLAPGFVVPLFLDSGHALRILRQWLLIVSNPYLSTRLSVPPPQTIALFGTSLFLLILPRLQTFMLSLICLGLAVACCGFHSSGILLNPQDIAPLHGGKVFGKSVAFHIYRVDGLLALPVMSRTYPLSILGIMSTIGTIPGFTGVYLTGYILQHWGSWSAVFHFAVLGNLFGWIVYSIFGSAKPLV